METVRLRQSPPLPAEERGQMEKYNYGFFEEPVPFDHLDETKPWPTR